MFTNIRLFLLILEKGGLSAAGREMGLSPASVSERLAALESYYGATLLTRTTRSIHLTNEGKLLAEGARRLLAESDEMESLIKHGAQKMSGVIRLSAPVDLGQNRIVPILDQFLEDHPDVTVDLNLTDSFVDLVGQGIDFAVRYGTLEDSMLKAKPIGENRRLICASPAYLQRSGVPLHPEDLVHHECILMRFAFGLDRSWSFHVDGKPYVVNVHGQRTANNGELVKHWALQGYGLCKKSVWDVQADLETGKLIEVLAPFSLTLTALHIVYPASRAQPRRVRALMEAIASALAIDSV